MPHTQHTVVIIREPNPSCDCCALNQHYVRPTYTKWLKNNGVSETDFSQLVNPLIDRANQSANRCVPYTIITVLSCGLIGWCCQLREISLNINAVRIAIDNFNLKYKNKRIHVAGSPGALVFTLI